MTVFGAIVAQSDLEDACVATVDYWIDTYLAEVERQHSLTVPTLARPRSYQETYDTQNWNEGQLPGITIICKGTTGTPEYNDDRTISAWFEVDVDVLLADQTEKLTRRGASSYQAALLALLVQRKSLNGAAGAPFASDLRFVSSKIELPDPNNRTLSVGSVTVHVLLGSIASSWGGPDVRPVPPESVPPDPPTVSSVHVRVSKLT